MGVQLSDVLFAVHSHLRDVKPANLLLHANGEFDLPAH